MKRSFCYWFSTLPFFLLPLNAPAGLTLQGPIFPPAGGVGFVDQGASDGRTGGNNWYFTNAAQAATNVLYWGASNNGVAMSFYESNFNSTEIMNFDPIDSSLSNGVLIWNGYTQFQSGQPVYTRFVLTISNRVGPVPLTVSNAATLDLPMDVGGVIFVRTNLGWQANLQFLASFTPGGPFTPALNFFDTNHMAPNSYTGEAFSSFQAGFYFDTPPRLVANNPLTAGLDTTNVITSSLLQATDTESDPSLVIFTIDPSGGPPHAGYLQIGGTNLVTGSTFSQADINAGKLTYVQNGTCSSFDGFTFNINDSDHGVASDGGFTNFDFNININESNLPPVANNQSIGVGLGASYPGFLTASNPNCVPVPFTYRVIASPTKGNVVINNTNTGAFTYTATLGQSGADSFSFQVNDGIVDAAAPGVVSISISNQPPTPLPGSGTTMEGVAYSGQFAATDPDQPPEPLTYSVTGGGVGVLGTAVVTNSSTGGFIYTPNPGAFGVDAIHFQAYDGSLYSPTGTFLVSIRPRLDAGRALVTDQNSASIVEIDPVNGYYFPVSSSNLLSQPGAIALEASGTVIVSDTNGLVRVDTITGNQTPLSSSTNFSSPLGEVSGLAIRPDGSILGVDFEARIARIDPVTGAVTNISSGGSLGVPLALVIARNGNIYATDPAAFMGGVSHLDVINPVGGIATTQAISGTLNFPVGITADSSNLYVLDTNPFGGSSSPPPSLYSINPANGLQTLISSNGFLSFGTGAAFTTNHLLLVALNQSASTNSLIVVDPTSGNQGKLPGPVGGFVMKPFDVTVVPLLPPPPVIIHSASPAQGQFLLQFNGDSNATYSVFETTDLMVPTADWPYLGPATLLSNNLFQFLDFQATNSQEFYRLRSP